MVKTVPEVYPLGKGYRFGGYVDGSEGPAGGKCQIVTHDDMDGYAAAAIAYNHWLRLGRCCREEDVKICHCNYQNPPEIDSDAVCLIITDYSISTPEVAKVVIDAINRGVWVIWLDHHKSSIDFIESSEEYACLREVCGIRNTKYCGAALAYSYFYPLWHPPKLIELIDDWDCWKKQFPESEWLNAAFYNYRNPLWDKDPKSKSWKLLLFFSSLPDSTAPSAAFDLLKGMLEYGKHFTEVIKDHYYTTAHSKAIVAKLTKFQDLEDDVIVLIGDALGSQYFSDLLESEDFPDGMFKIALSIRPTIDQWVCSVYTSEHACKCAMDICTAYGGGGHPRAAGFQVKYGNSLPIVVDSAIPIVEYLKNRSES